MISSFRAAPWAFALLLLLAAVPSLRAQDTANVPARPSGRPGEIRGRIVEAATGTPIASGSIAAQRAGDASSTAGATPGTDGSFRVDGLAPGRYTVRVRSLGYAPLVRSDIVISAEHPVAELGTLKLSAVATQIAGQVVTAEREDAVLAPDRNSYSTKNMTTASGGTAIDVLRNVPSVEVDGSNNVSLRGNQNVVVQINGRPTPLHGDQLGNFLAQLPAKTIKRVEVSTNPSAKNDPEGTAGIINIILDQDADIGLSGGIMAGTGSTGMANVNGNIGRQSGPLTLFLSYGFFRDDRPMDGFSSQTNLALATPAFVDARFGGSAQPRSQNVTFRSEYRFTKQDALSLDAMLSDGHFTRSSASYYSDLDASRDTIGLYDLYNDMLSRNLFQDYALAFRRTGDAKSRTFSTELHMSASGGTNDADLFGVLRQGDASTGAMAIPREHDITKNQNPSWSWQADYTQPFGHTKLESGLKGTLRHTTNDFSAAYLDSASGQFVAAPERATDFDYREEIGAGYAVLSQQVGRVQAQGGLRLEQAATRFDLPSAANAADRRHDTRYASAFPSGILSYNFTPMRQLKLSYSRRVSRPNPFQLSPVVFREDARNEFHGNPDLRAEYTDAVELGFQDTHGWGTLQLTPYVRRTAHAVRFIQTIDSSGVSVGTFDNVASLLAMGTELNLTVHRGPLTLLTGGGAYEYRSDAANLAASFGDLSTRAFVWNTRANVTWKLSSVLDAQMFANYRAPYRTEGGSQSSFTFMNVALRRKLWNDRGSLTIRVADPFNMMHFGARTENDRVVQLTQRSFGMRGVFITFSRNFGQQLKLRPRQVEDQPQQQGPGQPGVP